MDTEFGAGGVTTVELISRFDTRFGADKPTVCIWSFLPFSYG